MFRAEYGGLGLDFSYSMALSEELGNIRCGGIPMAIGVQTDMATPALARYNLTNFITHDRAQDSLQRSNCTAFSYQKDNNKSVTQATKSALVFFSFLYHH